MDYYKKALELNQETIENRRYIHKNAETGLYLPKTRNFVIKKLKEYGLNPTMCGEGVTATLGNSGKVILLRADMDALPMPEESDLPFACPTKKEAHTCGHDLHTAMLLTATKMLKENETNLKGTVKLMFQPAEETFEGGKNMIENGILDSPKVDVALAYHVSPGRMPVGIYMYNSTSTMMYSADGFRIEIKGKGSHGAYPHKSIDPINIATHIYLSLESLIAREIEPSKACVLTIGKFQAGTTANIIPDIAILEGTIRSNDKLSRELLIKRMKEISTKTAEAFGGEATINMISSVPPLICNSNLTEEIINYMKEMNIEKMTPYPNVSSSASEDFASIAEKVPSTFIYLSAGYMDERGNYSAHNTKVQFNEDVLPIGASCLAHSATRWLEEHSQN